MTNWRQIEPGVLPSFPSKLEGHDICHFAREYFRRRGGSFGDGNNLISNFKIEPTDPKYEQKKSLKFRAAYQFASELSDFLPNGATVCHVPTSKIASDPAFDPRFEAVFRRLQQVRSDLRIETPFSVSASHHSVHTGGDRSIDKFYSYLRWEGLSQPAPIIFIVDDVITSGSHFKACKKMLLENTENIEAHGVFWTATVHVGDDRSAEFEF